MKIHILNCFLILILVVNLSQATVEEDKCRDVFRTKGQGGIGELTVDDLNKRLSHKHVFDVKDHLK